MRPQQNRRIRGRNNNNNNNNRRGPNPLTRNYESNGPDVKIRGNAQHIADKYAALARDVQAAGDRVMAENYLQHAEHYMRIILSAQPQFAPPARQDTHYEEDEAANIVDLSLVDGVVQAEEESRTIDENLLQLVVDRDSESGGAAKSASPVAQHDENLDDTSQQQPKIERTRRLARRRMPRQMTNMENDADNQATRSGKSAPNLAIEQQERIDAPFLLAPSPVMPTPLQEEVVATEKLEKPRRKRRVVKAADDEAAAQ